jgi:hypothetical protein
MEDSTPQTPKFNGIGCYNSERLGTTRKLARKANLSGFLLRNSYPRRRTSCVSTAKRCGDVELQLGMNKADAIARLKPLFFVSPSGTDSVKVVSHSKNWPFSLVDSHYGGVATPLGFEPRITPPKGAVLPLHHGVIDFGFWIADLQTVARPATRAITPRQVRATEHPPSCLCRARSRSRFFHRALQRWL